MHHLMEAMSAQLAALELERKRMSELAAARSTTTGNWADRMGKLVADRTARCGRPGALPAFLASCPCLPVPNSIHSFILAPPGRRRLVVPCCRVCCVSGAASFGWTTSTSGIPHASRCRGTSSRTTSRARSANTPPSRRRSLKCCARVRPAGDRPVTNPAWPLFRCFLALF